MVCTRRKESVTMRLTSPAREKESQLRRKSRVPSCLARIMSSTGAPRLTARSKRTRPRLMQTWTRSDIVPRVNPTCLNYTIYQPELNSPQIKLFPYNYLHLISIYSILWPLLPLLPLLPSFFPVSKICLLAHKVLVGIIIRVGTKRCMGSVYQL